MSKTVEVDTKTFVRFWLVIMGLGVAAALIIYASTGLLIVGLAIFLVIVVTETTNFLREAPEMLQNNNATWDKVNEVGRFFGIEDAHAQIVSGLLDGFVTWLIVFAISFIFGFSSGLAFPMALIAAIFYLIPMFGPLITAVVVSLITFISAPIAGLVFLVVYVVYEQIENNIIALKIQGNALDLPSVIILISIAIGIYTFGLLGAIISISIAGMVKVLIDEYPNIRALREKE